MDCNAQLHNFAACLILHMTETAWLVFKHAFWNVRNANELNMSACRRLQKSQLHHGSSCLITPRCGADKFKAQALR